MNTTFYFKHDNNARSDEKIVKLRQELGIEGYGVYFIILEVLATASGSKLLLSSLDTICFDLHLNLEIVEKVVNNYFLFQRDEEYFWSSRLLEHQAQIKSKSKSAKKAADIRWEEERKGLEKKINLIKHKNLMPLFKKFLIDRRKKVANTQSSVEAQVETINAMTEKEAEIAIKASIASGWTGIFPKKAEVAGKKEYDPFDGFIEGGGVRN